MIPLERSGVTIRYLLPEDHASYVALERDPAVRRYLGEPSRDPGARLSEYEPSNVLLVVAESATNRFIGRCGLIPCAEGLELHCALEAKNQGKGVGSIVFGILTELAVAGGKTPFALVHPENIASGVALRRLGYRHVGEYQEAGKQFGHNKYVYASG